MFKKILIIIVALLAIILAFMAGYWSAGKNVNTAQNSSISVLTKSPLFQSWTASAYGEVTAISGRTIALTFGGESISVSVKEDAAISLVSFLEIPKEGVNPKTESKQIQFSDIKIGDKVSAIIEVKENGDFLATNVSIIEEMSAAK